MKNAKLYCSVLFGRKCIECLGFTDGPYQKNCSTACNHLTHTTVEKLNPFNPDARKCEVKDSKNCWLDFTMKELQGFDKYEVEIQKERSKTS